MTNDEKRLAELEDKKALNEGDPSKPALTAEETKELAELSK